jgi:hypothetical protein
MLVLLVILLLPLPASLAPAAATAATPSEEAAGSGSADGSSGCALVGRHDESLALLLHGDDGGDSFTFGTASFAMVFDRESLALINVTTCSSDNDSDPGSAQPTKPPPGARRRQQGFLWPAPGVERFSLWQLQYSDCSVALPGGSRLDALNSTVAGHSNYSVTQYPTGLVLTLQWLGVAAEPAGTTMDVAVTVTMGHASAQAALRGSVEVHGEPVCIQSMTLPNFERLVLRSPAQDKLFTPSFYGVVGDQSGMCGGGDCTLDSLDIQGSALRYRGFAFMPNGNERAMQWAALYSTLPSPTSPPLGLYVAAHSPRADLMMLLMKGEYCPAHTAPDEPEGWVENKWPVNATLRPGRDNGISGGELPHAGLRFPNHTGCARHCGENRECRSWTWNSQTKDCYPKPKVGVFRNASSTAAHDVSGCSPSYPVSDCVDSPLPPSPPAPRDDCGSYAGMRWLHFPENSMERTTSWSMWYDVVLSGFEGDWWDAAMIYREWALTHAVWAQRGNLTVRAAEPGYPTWLLETPLWGATGGDPNSSTYPADNIRLAAALGTPVGTQWYNWQTQPFDHDYPVMTPRPGFGAAVAKMQASKRLLSVHIWYKKDRFTKTGSGQTNIGKTPKMRPFCRRLQTSTWPLTPQVP